MEKITTEMVLNWVGNGGYAEKQLDFMFKILKEIANKEYDPKILRTEILNYNKS